MIQTLSETTHFETVADLAQTPEEVIAKYQQVDDLFVPATEELILLYTQFGTIQRHRTIKTCFALTLASNKVIDFRTRQQAWNYYQKHRQGLEQAASQRPCPF